MRLWGVLDGSITNKDASLIRLPFTSVGWLGIGLPEGEWAPETEITSTWTPKASASPDWTPETKPDSVWTPSTARSSSWAVESTPTTTWIPFYDLIDYLVLYYKMDDNAANTTVTDYSINDYHGTAQQNTADISTGGKELRALSFNGTSDYIDTGETFQSLIRTGRFSISFWTTVSHQLGVFLGQEDAIGADSWLTLMKSGRSGLCDILFQIGSEGTAVAAKYEDILRPDLTVWHHICATYDETSTTGCKVYVDGVLGNVVGNPVDEGIDTSIYNMTHSLYIGNYNDDGVPSRTGYLLANMDEVMFFSKALTQADVDRLYAGSTSLSWSPETKPTSTWTPKSNPSSDWSPKSLPTTTWS